MRACKRGAPHGFQNSMSDWSASLLLMVVFYGCKKQGPLSVAWVQPTANEVRDIRCDEIYESSMARIKKTARITDRVIDPYVATLLDKISVGKRLLNLRK